MNTWTGTTTAELIRITLRRIELPPPAKAILIALIDHAGDAVQGRTCWPSMDTLATVTGYTRRTIARYTTGESKSHIAPYVSVESRQGRVLIYTIDACAILAKGVKQTARKRAAAPHKHYLQSQEDILAETENSTCDTVAYKENQPKGSFSKGPPKILERTMFVPISPLPVRPYPPNQTTPLAPTPLSLDDRSLRREIDKVFRFTEAAKRKGDTSAYRLAQAEQRLKGLRDESTLRRKYRRRAHFLTLAHDAFHRKDAIEYTSACMSAEVGFRHLPDKWPDDLTEMRQVANAALRERSIHLS